EELAAELPPQHDDGRTESAEAAGPAEAQLEDVERQPEVVHERTLQLEPGELRQTAVERLLQQHLPCVALCGQVRRALPEEEEAEQLGLGQRGEVRARERQARRAHVARDAHVDLELATLLIENGAARRDVDRGVDLRQPEEPHLCARDLEAADERTGLERVRAALALQRADERQRLIALDDGQLAAQLRLRALADEPHVVRDLDAQVLDTQCVQPALRFLITDRRQIREVVDRSAELRDRDVAVADRDASGQVRRTQRPEQRERAGERGILAVRDAQRPERGQLNRDGRRRLRQLLEYDLAARDRRALRRRRDLAYDD